MSKYAPHRSSTSHPRATPSTICQKCLGRGHYIYECKSTRPYVSRPSRTQLMEKPSLLAKLRAEGKPSVEVPEEFKKSGTANQILEAKEKERAAQSEKEKDGGKPKKKARRGSSDSGSSSGSDSSSSSDSDSGSDSDSSSSSSGSRSSSSDSRSSSGSSRSRTRDAKRRVPRKDSRS